MNQGIHLENPSFEVAQGQKIIIPPGAAAYFIRPHIRAARWALPRLACLQPAGKKNGRTLFRFAVYLPSNRGFKLFLPAGLAGGDEVVVAWRNLRSAAAVKPQDLESYLELVGHIVPPDPAPAGWD
ncbi:MAG: hypothetical protein PHO91_02220 [Patescibacteria group bacterium]|nr:hypothetical protein [Patescibacteria group bacterium]